jgi:hypothetical protein
MSIKKILASTLSACLIAGIFAGCSGAVVATDDVSTYPRAAITTALELHEYQKAALSFDSVATKDPEVQEIQYVTRDPDDATKEKLEALVAQVESVLGQKEFDLEEDNPLISEEIFNYIKTTFDDKKLTNGYSTSHKEALGFYFVDRVYDVSARNSGRFTDKSLFLGINGAFRRSPLSDRDDYIDTAFMEMAVNKINDYYFINRIHKFITLDKENVGITLENRNVELEELEAAKNATIEQADSAAEDSFAEALEAAVSTEEETTSEETGEEGDPVEGEETTAEEGTENVGAEASEEDLDIPEVDPNAVSVGEGATNYGDGMDKIEYPEEPKWGLNPVFLLETKEPQLDIKMINSVVGNSITQSAYIPRLDIVYNIPESEGTLSGYGIYPCGDFGLGEFGWGRASMSGTVTLRYLFKDDPENPENIKPINIYPVKQELTSGIDPKTEEPQLPEFVTTELSKMVERLDRALVNNDINALMTTDIVNNIGIPVLRGHERKYVNVNRNLSVMRRVISRAGNSYLIEVESIREEGAMDTRAIGVYRDRYYMVIAQEGTNFKVKDYVLHSRVLTKEPALNPDSAIVKRLIALNLSGDVTPKNQNDITLLINGLYEAGTSRKMSGPWTDSNGAEHKLGINDCFNDDTSLLSVDQRQYTIQQLQIPLIKYTPSVASDFKGVVTEWLSGSDRQAEFMTEEVITYAGRGDGEYMQVYYLVSKMNDVWKIDERRILLAETQEGETLQTVKKRIDSGFSTAVASAVPEPEAAPLETGEAPVSEGATEASEPVAE